MQVNFQTCTKGDSLNISKYVDTQIQIPESSINFAPKLTN